MNLKPRYYGGCTEAHPARRMGNDAAISVKPLRKKDLSIRYVNPMNGDRANATEPFVGVTCNSGKT